MSEPFLAKPLPKGRPGQIAFVRVRIMHGDDTNGTIFAGTQMVVEPVNRMGTGSGTRLYVSPDSVVTIAEAKQSLGGAA